MKKNQRLTCGSCGKKWVEHLGIMGTCKALQIALDGLRQIETTPRNVGARRTARAILLFLETQTEKGKP